MVIRRRSLSPLLVVIALALTPFAACRSDPAGPGDDGPSAADTVVEQAGARLPISELSGLAIRARAKATQVLAVGDEAGVLLVTPLTDLSNAKAARALPLGLGERKGGSDFEAVATDTEGRVYVLEEGASRVRLFQLAGDTTAELVHTYHLDIPEGHPLAEARAEAENARGEGLLVAPNGRLIIAKQKDPPAIIEFGAAGQPARGVAPGNDAAGMPPTGTESHLAPLAYWILDEAQAKEQDIRSINDLARHPDGGLYVVGSKKRGWIGRVKLPLSPREVGFHLTQVWSVPAASKGRDVEAIAITADGRFLIGFDGEDGDVNVVVLDALR